MERPKILSVGQCSLDHGTLVQYLGRHLHAEVVRADEHGEAVSELRAARFDLVLVNRVGDADGARGIDLIRTLKADPALASVPVMLVSNFADAQSEAVGLGATRGFGKSELGSPGTLERIRQAMQSSASATAGPAAKTRG